MPAATRLAVAVLGLALAAAGPVAAQGLIEDQFCNISCDAAGPFGQCQVGLIGGIQIDALRADISALGSGDGVALTGLTIGAIPIEVRPPATVEARFSDPQPGACSVGFDILRGEVVTPNPIEDILAAADMEITSRPMAAIGLDVGRNLIADDSLWCVPGQECACTGNFCLDTPIPRSDAHYIVFDLDAGLQLRMGGVFLTFPAGLAVSFVFDPLDPFFYIQGAAFGLPIIPAPPLPGGGVGFSRSGEIPFYPWSTYGVEDKLVPFGGDFAFELSGDVVKVGDPKSPILQVRGNGVTVASLDPDKDGDHPFDSFPAFDADPDLAVAGNGSLEVRWNPFGKKGKAKKGKKSKKPAKPAKDPKPGKCKKNKPDKPCSILSVRTDLGTASWAYRMSAPDVVEFWASGMLGVDGGEILPPWMPLPMTGSADTRMVFRVSPPEGEAMAQAEGSFSIETTNLGAKITGLNPSVTTLGGLLRVDLASGFTVIGHTDSQLHDDLEQHSTAEVEVRIPPHGAATLALRTDFSFGANEFVGGEIVLRQDEVGFGGSMRIGETDFEALGSIQGRTSTLEATAVKTIPYSRDGTEERIRLLRELIANQQNVDAARTGLALAEQLLAGPAADYQHTADDVAAAEAEVARIQGLIDAVDAEISGLEADLHWQANVRNCNADYSGCPSCSSCTSRCNCGTIDPVCWADCGACQTARQTCLGARETCRLANVAPCESNRALRISELGLAIAAKEAERTGLVTAKNVALGVLAPLQDALQNAATALATAQGVVATAQKGLDAALAGLALVESQLDNLPDLEFEVDTRLSIVTKTKNGVSKSKGKVEGFVDGKRVTKGHVDLDAEPPIACIQIPDKRIGEVCAFL